MTNNYKLIRVHTETLNKLKIRRETIEKNLNKITGKRTKIPMIRLMELIADKPIYADDYEIKERFKPSRRKRWNLKKGKLKV